MLPIIPTGRPEPSTGFCLMSSSKHCEYNSSLTGQMPVSRACHPNEAHIRNNESTVHATNLQILSCSFTSFVHRGK